MHFHNFRSHSHRNIGSGRTSVGCIGKSAEHLAVGGNIAHNPRTGYRFKFITGAILFRLQIVGISHRVYIITACAYIETERDTATAVVLQFRFVRQAVIGPAVNHVAYYSGHIDSCTAVHDKIIAEQNAVLPIHEQTERIYVLHHIAFVSTRFQHILCRRLKSEFYRKRTYTAVECSSYAVGQFNFIGACA